MSDLVLTLIQRAKKEAWEFLDLGNCGLKELPIEICDLKKLKRLNLGYAYYDWRLKKFVNSKNRLEKNRISEISFLTKLIWGQVQST